MDVMYGKSQEWEFLLCRLVACLCSLLRVLALLSANMLAEALRSLQHYTFM